MRMKKLFGLLVALWLCIPAVSLAQISPRSDNGLSEQAAFLIAPPRPLNLGIINSRITYPPKAIQAGFEGWVQVRIQVDPGGNYLSHQVVRSPHPLLSEAVSPHVSCLQFSPARDAGNPVTSFIVIPFRFSLRPWDRRYRKGVPVDTLECYPKEQVPIPTMVKTH